MDTRVMVGTAVTPAEFCTQHGEHPIDLARAQRLAPTPAARADEERSLRSDLDKSVAQATVPPQSLGRTGVQWHLARLGELGSVNGQHTDLQVDVGDAQAHGLRDPQTRASDQTKQGLIGCCAPAWS